MHIYRIERDNGARRHERYVIAGNAVDAIQAWKLWEWGREWDERISDGDYRPEDLHDQLEHPRLLEPTTVERISGPFEGVITSDDADDASDSARRMIMDALNE